MGAAVDRVSVGSPQSVNWQNLHTSKSTFCLKSRALRTEDDYCSLFDKAIMKINTDAVLGTQKNGLVLMQQHHLLFLCVMCVFFC